MEFINVYEASVVDGAFLGLYQDELGESVVSRVVNSMIDVAVDFGGGERDVVVDDVVEACSGSATKLARMSGITRKEAKRVLAVCSEGV